MRCPKPLQNKNKTHRTVNGLIARTPSRTARGTALVRVVVAATVVTARFAATPRY